MSDNTKAIVVGVGPEAGLGGALCARLAREGLHVFVAGRTPAKVEALVVTIRNAGGRATGVPTDTTIERDVIGLFDRAETDGEGVLDLVIYNAGNAAMGQVHDVEASFFEQVWRVGCLGGLAGLADAYWYLYKQPKAAWTHELDLRTFKESF